MLRSLPIALLAACSSNTPPADPPGDAGADAAAPLDGGDGGGDVDGGDEDAAVPARCVLGAEPAWSYEGDVASQLGNAAAVLDVDGDDDADLAVGAWYARAEGTSTPEGRVIVFGNDGASLSAEPVWSAAGELGERADGVVVEASYFGAALARAGDVDGDGDDELLVSEPYTESVDAGDGHSRGRVLLFAGGPLGLSGIPVWALEPEDGRFRATPIFTAAGDVDADGYDDVVVGARRSGPWRSGRAALFLGSRDGLSMTPTWSLEAADRYDDVARGLVSAGDVDGDGFADLVVTSCGQHKVALYVGGPEGLSPRPSWSLYGSSGTCGMAASVGDANGDGFADVAAVVPPDGTQLTRIDLYLGGREGLPPDAASTILLPDGRAPMPATFAAAGDGDGDGHDDLVVAIPLAEQDVRQQGEVHVFRGAVEGWSGDPLWTAQGTAPGERLGTVAVALPDPTAKACAGLVVTTAIGRVVWYRPHR